MLGLIMLGLILGLTFRPRTMLACKYAPIIIPSIHHAVFSNSAISDHHELSSPPPSDMLQGVKPSRLARLIAAIALLPHVPAAAAPREVTTTGWFLAKSPNFEIYSQAGPDHARTTLLRFEQLRALFNQNRLFPLPQNPDPQPRIRVLEFRTAAQYKAVKLTPTADAYYSSAAGSDYIVMPLLAGNDFRIAAHEYAHFTLHAGLRKLPPWLNEGLAEIYSTVTLTPSRSEWGGSIPARADTLHSSPWLPAAVLFAPARPAQETRAQAAIFYAESWALADLLTSAPAYAPRFHEFADRLSRGIPSAAALTDIYGKSPGRILADTRDWMRHGASPKRQLPAPAESTYPIEVTPVSEWQTKAVLADLLLTNGDPARARQLYRDLLRQRPNDPNLLASLGTVALRIGDREEAIAHWQAALNHGLEDASLSYRYALLADQMNLPPNQIAQALERTVALRPGFDEARFRLAQLHSNQCDYRAALTQLQAIQAIPPARAFSYWSAVATARTQLGNRPEAEAAAAHAIQFAANPEERARAADLAYIVQTDLSVQFTRDAHGNPQLTTTRIPHGSTTANPFIEQNDRIRTIQGNLDEVQCTDGKLIAFRLQSPEGPLTLSVPDPTHIQIRNGPTEFTCGPQTPTKVKAEYTNEGILRGLEF